MPGRRLRSSASGGGLLGLVAFLLVVLTLRRTEDYRGDKSMWADAASKYPDNMRAQSNLGGILAERGQVDEALVVLVEAVQRKPDSGTCRRQLGQVLLRKGQREEARRHLTLALDLERNDPRPSYWLGVLNYYEGDLLAARDSFRRVVTMEPTLPQHRFALALTLAETGQLAAAAEHIEAGKALVPGYLSQSAASLKVLVLKAEDLSWYERSTAVFTGRLLCLATDRKDPVYLDLLAMAYARNDQFPDAVRTINEALALTTAPEQQEFRDQLLLRRRLFERKLPYLREHVRALRTKSP